MNFNDTIAAIATPPGEGGIGIVRISGGNAYEGAKAILKTRGRNTFSILEPRHMYYGVVVEPQSEQIVDEVLFFYAPKPRSFTAEDVVEIQAHGGPLVLAKILKLLLQQGIRMAEPGEFTMRAFLNGRIDLVQAESVIDLIRAKTDQGHELALAQLTGKATQVIHQLEADLYQILIQMEALLDFPEEGLPELEQEKILTKIQQIKEELDHLAAGINEGRKLREGIKVAIVGRPNVGKSSLLNALVQEDKAIVTDIPGTTRDVVEVQMQLGGVVLILNDTAGLRATDHPIEKLGIQRTEQVLEQAQLIILVLDGSQSLTPEDCDILAKVAQRQVLVVVNKADLPQQLSEAQLADFGLRDWLRISCNSRGGIDQLEEKLKTMIGIGALQLDDRPLLSRVRHQQAIGTAIICLQDFLRGLTSGISEDLLAVELRSALDALGEITGKNVNEQVLHGIFANFCIGK